MAYLEVTDDHAKKFCRIKNASFPYRDTQPLLPERNVSFAKICTPSYHQIFKNIKFGAISNEALVFSMSKSRLNRLNPEKPWIYNRGTNPHIRNDFAHGWEYLDVSPNGKCLITCWTMNYRSQHTSSIVESLRLVYDEEEAEKEKERRERDKYQNYFDPLGYNVLGVDFKSLDNSNCHSDSRVVEMVRAPFDTDVTSVLSVLAHAHYCRKPSTVKLSPLIGFNKPAEETDNQIGFELYSQCWEMDKPSWSGAFDSKKLQIAVGQDTGSRIIDVLSDKQFTVPSNNKTVISQAFYRDGNVLLCGRIDDDVGIIDLRARNKNIPVLHGSKSAGFVASLKTDPNHIITEAFSGAIQKWDLRTRTPSIIFEGHKNHHNKVPVSIDNKERFLFAVDDAGATRGWSLDTGELLCTIPTLDSPQNCSFFPRMAYSDNFGGKQGNSGLLLAHNMHFYLYDLFP